MAWRYSEGYFPGDYVPESSLAGGTNALHNILCFLHLITGRQGNNGDSIVLEAVGAAAFPTGEMDVIQMMIVNATADAILLKARPVVNLMQKMMFGKQTQRAENAGTVHLRHTLLHILQRKGLVRPAAFLPYQYADGGRLDVMLL